MDNIVTNINCNLIACGSVEVDNLANNDLNIPDPCPIVGSGIIAKALCDECK